MNDNRTTSPNFPPMLRRGDWIQTVTNRQFWPLDPRPEDVCLDDIATALSNLCRFGGHVDEHYSVAQHSVLVALNVQHHLRPQALLHDATEAYLVDVPRPIKKFLVNYDVIEARLAACIGDRFMVELCALDPRVVEADNRALATEKRDLKGPPPAPWANSGVSPWPAKITSWPVKEARKAFLALAAKLGIQ